MDSHGSVDQTIRAAKKELDAGNYRGALALLLPLLRAKEKLSPQQELKVVRCLSDRTATFFWTTRRPRCRTSSVGSC
jgi:hypothetical protein